MEELKDAHLMAGRQKREEETRAHNSRLGYAPDDLKTSH
jgi:hypothetical protein